MRLRQAFHSTAVLLVLCIPTFAQDSTLASADKPKHCSIDKHSKQPVMPGYPESLKGSGIKGIVTLQVVVGEDGCTQTITVVKKLHPQLDKLAKDAVQAWKFEPAMKDGKPVKVLTEVKVEFKDN
jgi:TonB family protein